jgi:hypothetical protein
MVFFLAQIYPSHTRSARTPRNTACWHFTQGLSTPFSTAIVYGIRLEKLLKIQGIIAKIRLFCAAGIHRKSPLRAPAKMKSKSHRLSNVRL